MLAARTLGYVWIDGAERNGAECNKMEWYGTERNGTIIPFHCLGIVNITEQIKTFLFHLYPYLKICLTCNTHYY
jgi:hypothetical protein